MDLSQLDTVRVDEIKQKLQTASGQLSSEEALYICKCATQAMKSEGLLVEVEGEAFVLGDLHGQFHDLLHHFEEIGRPASEGKKFVFLGDYVDKGPDSVELTALLMCLKILNSKTVFLIRGNHEVQSTNSRYGFHEECLKKLDQLCYESFNECFKYFPLAATINSKFFCCHAGIGPDLNTLEDIKKLRKPLEVPKKGLVCDILWSDPDETAETYGKNKRKISVTYGLKASNLFLERNKLLLIIRAHQCKKGGFQYSLNKTVLTVFSAPNYCDR